MDTWCKLRTKKNHGVYEPESRLYLLIIPFVLTTAGCIIFGFGVQNSLSWVSLFFGYGKQRRCTMHVRYILTSYTNMQV
jgi:hypothetical protein